MDGEGELRCELTSMPILNKFVEAKKTALH